jgi:hypothetical protein
MDRVQSGGGGSHRATPYIDPQGRLTGDPGMLVGPEVVERDGHGQPPRPRTPYFLDESRVPLPVSEAAFLLWVLVALVVVWLAIGVFLRIT